MIIKVEEEKEEDVDLYLQQMKAGNIINRLSRSEALQSCLLKC
jgi:hypothetical protein